MKKGKGIRKKDNKIVEKILIASTENPKVSKDFNYDKAKEVLEIITTKKFTFSQEPVLRLLLVEPENILKDILESGDYENHFSNLKLNTELHKYVSTVLAVCASQDKYSKNLKILFEKFPNITELVPDLLHFASYGKSKENTELLLSLKDASGNQIYPADKKDINGNTPLHLAVLSPVNQIEGQTKVCPLNIPLIKTLIGNNNQQDLFSVTNKDGYTPLEIFSAQNDHNTHRMAQPYHRKAKAEFKLSLKINKNFKLQDFNKLQTNIYYSEDYKKECRLKFAFPKSYKLLKTIVNQDIVDLKSFQKALIETSLKELAENQRYELIDLLINTQIVQASLNKEVDEFIIEFCKKTNDYENLIKYYIEKSDYYQYIDDEQSNANAKDAYESGIEYEGKISSDVKLNSIITLLNRKEIYRDFESILKLCHEIRTIKSNSNTVQNVINKIKIVELNALIYLGREDEIKKILAKETLEEQKQILEKISDLNLQNDTPIDKMLINMGLSNSVTYIPPAKIDESVENLNINLESPSNLTKTINTVSKKFNNAQNFQENIDVSYVCASSLSKDSGPEDYDIINKELQSRAINLKGVSYITLNKLSEYIVEYLTKSIIDLKIIKAAKFLDKMQAVYPEINQIKSLYLSYNAYQIYEGALQYDKATIYLKQMDSYQDSGFGKNLHYLVNSFRNIIDIQNKYHISEEPGAVNEILLTEEEVADVALKLDINEIGGQDTKEVYIDPKKLGKFIKTRKEELKELLKNFGKVASSFDQTKLWYHDDKTYIEGQNTNIIKNAENIIKLGKFSNFYAYLDIKSIQNTDKITADVLEKFKQAIEIHGLARSSHNANGVKLDPKNNFFEVKVTSENTRLFASKILENSAKNKLIIFDIVGDHGTKSNPKIIKTQEYLLKPNDELQNVLSIDTPVWTEEYWKHHNQLQITQEEITKITGDYYLTHEDA